MATDKEWKQLEIHLGMSLSDAYDSRERGTNEGSKLAGNAALWEDNESLEKNAAFGESGFSALPGGSRGDNYGIFTYLRIDAYFWSSTESDNDEAWCRRLYYKYSNVLRSDINKRNGFSVRCVKDADGASTLQQNKKSIVGVYVHEEDPENYLVLESDGTFCISQGGDKINGKYEKKGNTVALTFENGSGGELKIENDNILDPTGKRWIKE